MRKKKLKTAHPDKHPICVRLRNIVVGRQISYSQLARDAEIPVSTLWNVLEGATRYTRFDTVEKIVLAIDAAWMPIIEQEEHGRKADVVRLQFGRGRRRA